MCATWGTLDADSVRSLAWNRLSDFPDTEYEGGKDFIPVLDNSAQWRVSTNLRNTIRLRSRASISKDTTAEGRP